MNNNGMNICQIKGRLTRDPELAETKTGKKILSLSLAYNSLQSTDTDGSNANFIKVEAWEKIAEIFAPLLKKGVEILVNGNIVQNRWKDSEGNLKSYHKISANSISITDLNFRPQEI